MREREIDPVFGKVNVHTGTVRLLTWKEDLREFFKKFDLCLVGMNGTKYLTQEARDKGYSSNLDYLMDYADEVYKDTYSPDRVWAKVSAVLHDVCIKYAYSNQYNIVENKVVVTTGNEEAVVVLCERTKNTN